jgi:hypothetical protein
MSPQRRVSAAHLCWVVTNRLREIGFSPGFSLAVVPDATLGWRVVVAARSRPAMTPEHQRRLEEVERALRDSYALLSD